MQYGVERILTLDLVLHQLIPLQVFTKLLVDVNTDEAIKQNLILFMLRMSINYNRFSAMKIVASIMNEQIDKDYSRYKNLCNASSENVTPNL